jgi:hypothetical protein
MPRNYHSSLYFNVSSRTSKPPISVNITRLSSFLGCLGLSLGAAHAATTFATPLSLLQGGVGAGPTFDGTTLTLTTAANDQNNTASFDRSDVGTYPTANFAFSFRIFNANPAATADGFSMNFANTATYGASGTITPTFPGEEPNAAGILGFAFDTWNNVEDPGPDNSDLQQIALHYNGALVTAVDDTRVLGTPFLLDDGVVRNVAGTVNFGLGTVSLTVDGQSIFNNVPVPGLVPFESRIMFAGRTGGENELVELTGLNVNFIPEPGTIALGLIGTALLVRRRRSR